MQCQANLVRPPETKCSAEAHFIVNDECLCRRHAVEAVFQRELALGRVSVIDTHDGDETAETKYLTQKFLQFLPDLFDIQFTRNERGIAGVRIMEGSRHSTADCSTWDFVRGTEPGELQGYRFHDTIRGTILYIPYMD